MVQLTPSTLINIISLVVLTFSQSLKAEDLNKSKAAKSYNLMGYFQTQGQASESARIDASQISNKLSHTFFAFVEVDPKEFICKVVDVEKDTRSKADSNLRSLVSDSKCDSGTQASGNLAALYALKSKNPHQKIILSVGGASKERTESFVKATANPENSKKLAQSCARLALDYGFDGVDYDWESPEKQDQWNAYADLLQFTREEFDKLVDKSRYSVIITILQTAFTPQSEAAFNRISKLVDFVNLMTYDSAIGSDSALHDAAIYSTELSYDTPYLDSTVKSALKYFKPENINVGRPLYGYEFKVRFENTPINPDQPGIYGKIFLDQTTTLTYNQLRDNYLSNNDYKRYWDDKAKAAYLYNQNTKKFVTYTDDQAIDETITYVKNNHLGGIFFWHLGASYNFQNNKDELVEFAATKMQANKNTAKICANYSPFCNIKTECTAQELVATESKTSDAMSFKMPILLIISTIALSFSL